ncbi:MAG TPA: hypothetical protein VF498_11650 [Anaerolineales bacterium]
MDQQTIATSLAPDVIIDQVHGNLQVKGWERAEVVIKANPDELNLEEQDDAIRLSCQGDCAIRLPHGATVQVNTVHGEARFKLLEDQLTIEQVLGSLALRNVGEVHVESVHGEVLAKHLTGDLAVKDVLGNANVRDVQGQFVSASVHGNLDLCDVEGGVMAVVAGNARVRFSVMAGDAYELHAGGNLDLSVPEDASLTVKLSAASCNIRVKLPAESRNFQEAEHSFTLGGGAAKLEASAGGNLSFSAQEADGGDVEEEDFGAGLGRGSDEFSQQIAQQVEAQIEAQMEAMTRHLNQHMENLSSTMGRSGLSPEATQEILQRARETGDRMTAQAQERMRRAQEKLERKLESARRREEQRAQAAERRAHGRGRRTWNFEWASPAAPQPPVKEPVSDEERLMILRMLEQKKISLEEAETLLAALEGKGG